MLQKWVKYAQNRPFLCNFNVCCYLIHSTFQNEICYMTYYQTYHFKMFAMGKLYNHRYVSKVYLYSHDISNGSMHNKRFIILKHVWRLAVYFVFEVWRWVFSFKSTTGDKSYGQTRLLLGFSFLMCKHVRHTPEQVCKFQTKCNNDSRIQTFSCIWTSFSHWPVLFYWRGKQTKAFNQPQFHLSQKKKKSLSRQKGPKMVSMTTG